MTESTPAGSIIAEVRKYLRYIQDIGCIGLSCTPESRKIVDSWKERPEPPPESISAVSAAIAGCRRCPLSDLRKTAVVGEGPETARLMFLGGYPEAADETGGRPFCGEAGDLLTRIIEAIKFNRESVYICHAVKCRPAGDRAPNRFETKACRTYIERQIKAVRPEIICVLGEFAARALLRSDEPISRLRGRFAEFEGIRVMPTYDPAYLLANPSAKRAVWEDMKKVMKALSMPC